MAARKRVHLEPLSFMKYPHTSAKPKIPLFFGKVSWAAADFGNRPQDPSSVETSSARASRCTERFEDIGYCCCCHSPRYRTYKALLVSFDRAFEVTASSMTKLPTYAWPWALLITVQLLLLAPVQAQFFQQFFGGNGGGSMFGQREQEPPPSGDASWFEARVDAAQCTQYLCPRTLSCVSKPSHCPCPFPQQIRCSYKDTDSAAKDHAQRAGGTFDGVDAALDLGGTFCVTADSCDEVNRILHAKA